MCALIGALVAAVAGWRALPWKQHAELRAIKEPTPADVRLRSVWWSDEGWAIAVGAEGNVLVRGGGSGATDPSSWHVLPPRTDSDLETVVGGEFPTDPGWWPGSEAHAIAVGPAAILDCTSERCVSLATGFGYRAASVAGGEGLVVGDGGSIVRVVPWFAELNAPLPERGGRALSARPITDLGLSSSFRSVKMVCADDAEQTCEAVIRGADGVVVHGRRTGQCDNGARASGSMLHWCRWTWKRDAEPALPPDAERLRAWTPVDVIETKLLAKRTDHTRALVEFGESSRARIDGVWLPLTAAHRFVAASTPFLDLGKATLLVDDAGDVYLAR